MILLNRMIKKKKRVYVRSSIGKEVMALDFRNVEYVFSPSLLKMDKEKDKK